MLTAHGSKQKKKPGQKDKKKGEKCENCSRLNHVKVDCYQKEGGKEGQVLWVKKNKKEDKKTEDSEILCRMKRFSHSPVHQTSQQLQVHFTSPN